jgi:hypothetical protein
MTDAQKLVFLQEFLVIYAGQCRIFERVSNVSNIHALSELLRLAGHIDALALRVVEPPVIAATKPLFLDPAPFERGASVRAMRFESSDTPLLVAEDDEFLFAGAIIGQFGYRWAHLPQLIRRAACVQPEDYQSRACGHQPNAQRCASFSRAV